jgi:hypothetical protein
MIIGKFIGTNSCGFKKGGTYMIKISIKRFQGKYCIFLRDLKSNAECPYSSLDSLLRNWMIIGE